MIKELRGSLTEMKKENKMEKIFIFLFAFLLSVQLIVLVYFNMTQLKYHLGYDISSNFLKAMEMVKQQKAFPDQWYYTTSKSIMDITALAALVYTFTKDIYAAFGLANLLTIAVSMIVLWKIFSLVNVSITMKLAGLNFYLCPFITVEYNNACDLGYAANMLLCAGFYSISILVVFLCALHLLTQKRTIRYAVYGILLSVVLSVTAFAGGLFIWSTFLIAGTLYYIVIAVWLNDRSYLKTYNFWFLAGNSVLSILARMIADRIFGFKTRDSNLSFTLAGDFFGYIGNIFEGFIQFVGGLPVYEEIIATSSEGLSYLMSWIVIGLFFMSIVWTVRQVNKKKHHWTNFLLFIILENIGLFAICNVTYGAAIFEGRYLLILLFALLGILLLYLDHLNENRCMRTIFVTAFFCAILILDISGDNIFLKTKNDYQDLEQVAATVDNYDSPIVYAYGSEIFSDIRNLRVLDQSKIYRSMADYNYCNPWGEYLYYQDIADYAGENCLITTTEDFDRLPAFIKKDYSFVTGIDKYMIYHSDNNKFDLSSEMAQHTIDFPYSYGYVTCNGKFDHEGRWVTDGTEGYCLYGPYCETKRGVYDITLKYEILESGQRPNVFDIAIDNGNKILASTELNPNEQSLKISGLKIEGGEFLEYRVFNSQDCMMRISSVEVIRQEEGDSR